MNWLRKSWCRAVLAAVAGMVFVSAVPKTGETGKKEPLTVQYTAWWGTLYPRFCFARINDEEEDGKSPLPVKKTFWIKRFIY